MSFFPPTLASTSDIVTKKISFLGNGGRLFQIYLSNLILMLNSFGTYYFWGKAKVRNYLYIHTEFEGDHFRFHGTGQELLVGWLKVVIFVGLYIFFIGMGQAVWPEYITQEVSQLITIVLVSLSIPFAIVGSRRYRMSRSSWKGIRFSFRGRVRDFFVICLLGSFYTILTLGIYYPFMHKKIREFLVCHTYIGERHFSYSGRGTDLFHLYVSGLALSILTVGIYWFWFSASKERYHWDHVSLIPLGCEFGTGGAGIVGSESRIYKPPNFRSTVTGEGLLLLRLGNLALLLITLGFAFPWIEVRNFRYLFDHLHVKSFLDLAGIKEEVQEASAVGEGVTEFLDTGFLEMN